MNAPIGLTARVMQPFGRMIGSPATSLGNAETVTNP
jgi:hypothetical protein